MTANAILEDTALAALISSKICHDLAGQIGAINNGLELLEEENDEDTRYYALELISKQREGRMGPARFQPPRLRRGLKSWRCRAVGSCRAGGATLCRERQAQDLLAGQCPGRRKGACQTSAGGAGCFPDGAPRWRRLLCRPFGDKAEGSFEVPAQIDYLVPGTFGAHPGGGCGCFCWKGLQGDRWKAGDRLLCRPVGRGSLAQAFSGERRRRHHVYAGASVGERALDVPPSGKRKDRQAGGLTLLSANEVSKNPAIWAGFIRWTGCSACLFSFRLPTSEAPDS